MELVSRRNLWKLQATSIQTMEKLYENLHIFDSASKASVVLRFQYEHSNLQTLYPISRGFPFLLGLHHLPRTIKNEGDLIKVQKLSLLCKTNNTKH